MMIAFLGAQVSRAKGKGVAWFIHRCQGFELSADSFEIVNREGSPKMNFVRSHMHTYQGLNAVGLQFHARIHQRRTKPGPSAPTVPLISSPIVRKYSNVQSIVQRMLVSFCKAS